MGTGLEIGVLVYPDAQRAAVHGLTDLFTVANQVACELGDGKLLPIRISHWQLDQAGELCEVYDSLPGPRHDLKVLVVCIGPDGRPARIPDYVRGVLPRMTQSE